MFFLLVEPFGLAIGAKALELIEQAHIIHAELLAGISFAIRDHVRVDAFFVLQGIGAGIEDVIGAAGGLRRELHNLKDKILFS